MAFVLGRGFVEMDLDDAKINKGLTKFQGRLKKFEVALNRWVKRIGVIVGGGIMAALGFSAKEAASAAEAQAKLAAVLKATGNAAGLSLEQLKAQADELEKLAEIEDDVVTNTQAILATFKEIKGPIFTGAIKAIADMSAVIGQDMRQGAIQLGKALNDPIRGVTALRRVGVSFTAQQIEQIKVLTESGQIMQAQMIILEELQSEFGGAAQRISEAGTGLKGLMNIIKDTGEAFADPLLKYLRETNKELGILFDPERARIWGKAVVDTMEGLGARTEKWKQKPWYEKFAYWSAGLVAETIGDVDLSEKIATRMFGKTAPLAAPTPAKVTGARIERGLAAGRAALAAAEKTSAELKAQAEAEETAAAMKDIAATNALIAERQMFGDPVAAKFLEKIAQRQDEIRDLEEDIANAEKTFTPSLVGLDDAWNMLSTTTIKADDKKIQLLKDQIKEQKDLNETSKAMLAVLEAGPTFQ